MSFYRLLVLFFFILFNSQVFAQKTTSLFYQNVNVEEFTGSKFTLSGKVFVEKISQNSGVVPVTFNSSGTEIIGEPVLDLRAMDKFFKPNEWTTFTLNGKINKNSKVLAVGFMYSGKCEIYFDDLELLIDSKKGEGQNLLSNSGFEDRELYPWFLSNKPKETQTKIDTERVFSGDQSFLIDNSNFKSFELGENSEVGSFKAINGINIYYEIYGEGKPLVLLHGNNESISSFSQQVNALAREFKVIVLDTRCHGQSGCNEEKLSYELFAEDVNELLEELNIDRSYILGWSDGGNTGLILAHQYPERVEKLAIMAAVLYNDDSSIDKKVNRILQRKIKEMESQGVSKTDINLRLTKLLMEEPNLDAKYLNEIDLPVLVMAGQKDIVKFEHTQLIADNLPNSKLKIFKKAGHQAPIDIPDIFNETVLEFFNE
ncbi:alpha/beta fold hydrolase [Echinicola shivajiensis]|uniref:alpha/beta fold hydrolase n=1 Tax=Echinicola shivajiensis TaxID=1035916 RepID=UPI001BFC96D7|nr:alpha/beta hydrolase [Echinicola shivajiensis]